MKLHPITVLCLALCLCGRLLAESQAPPFPTAIDIASIAQTIDDVNCKAVIICNGEMNALRFSNGNEIVLRFSRNDVWNTWLAISKDAPMAKVDVNKHSLHGVQHPSSWNNPILARSFADFFHVANPGANLCVAPVFSCEFTIDPRNLWNSFIFHETI